MSLTLSQLIEQTNGVLHFASQPGSETTSNPEPSGEPVFNHISLNSSELTDGSLFAALPGLHVHGASYAKGTPAAAILTDAEGAKLLREAKEDRPVIEVADIRKVLGKVSSLIFGDPSKDMLVIGVTGTSGKTTTTYLLEAGFIAEGHKVGLIGTTGTRIEGQAIETKLTTPEAPKLQELFAQMRDRSVTHVVMEVSSHAISLGRVAGTHFAAGGFTNLSQDHLDFHDTMEEYFEAKSGLFRAESELRPQQAVIMVDDEWGRRMAELAGPEVVTVSLEDSEATVTVSDLTVELSGVQDFTVDIPSGLSQTSKSTAQTKEEFPVRLALPGRFNVANAALAVTLAAAVGSDISAFIEGIENVGVPGRMERIDEGQDFLAVVDYAHKPAAVTAVLDSVRSQVKGRVAVVLGAGGDRDAKKRPLMGKAAVEGAEFVIVTDDNPRSEDPASIRTAVMEGALTAAQELNKETRIEEIGDRGAAIVAAVQWAEPGDAIIIAGKGHENGQLVGEVNHPFDDREHVRDALKTLVK